MARKMERIIITCAVTGGVHTPTMSEALPVSPDEIAAQSIEAAEAGASIIHLHARDPRTGQPTPNPDIYMQFLPHIRQSTDAVINITTGGGIGMSMEDRLAAAVRTEPEMCSLNMGSMNFALHPMAGKYPAWKHDWEKPFLLASEDMIFRNTFRDIARTIERLGDGCGTKFEHECYDIGHLYNLAHFVDTGLIKPPFLIQSIFGVLGGIGADMSHVVHMKETADRLFGDDYIWSLFATGRNQMRFVTQGAMMGGNIRVGLEDSLFIGKGQLARSNAEQVGKARRLLEELGLEVASPADARAALGLKGGDMVKF